MNGRLLHSRCTLYLYTYLETVHKLYFQDYYPDHIQRQEALDLYLTRHHHLLRTQRTNVYGSEADRD